MEETITIFRADTGAAVKSIADLRESIKALKENLETADIGSKKYADTLSQLQIQQAALKNAMHATTQAGDDQSDTFAATARAAKGLGTSYNALVKQMADLDQQFRATEDAAERTRLGEQIKAINEQLKIYDADRGKFGRQVGDYFNQAKEAMKSVIQDLPSSLGLVKKGMDDVSKSMGLLSKQPILGIISLLAPLINQIVAGLKDNKTALDAVKKVMDSLQPVFDFFQGVLEKIAGLFSKAVDYVLELGQKSGIEFKNIVSGAVGVGNAILQFILTPIRNTIDGAKALGNVFQQVFKGQFKEAAQTAKQAVKDIGENFKKGFDFNGNYEAGKKVGEEFAAGLKSTKRNAKDAAKAVKDEAEKELKDLVTLAENAAKEAESAASAALSAWEKEQADILAREKRWESQRLNDLKTATERRTQQAELEIKDERDLEQRRFEIQQEGQQARLDLLRQFREDASDRGDVEAMLDYEQQIADMEYEIEYQGALRRKKVREDEAKARIEGLMELAGATSSILGSIADLYDENAEEDEAAAQKAKALRTASAIIDTISGAVGAYMQTVKTLPAPWNIPAAAANAAAVLAAGYAQIRSINAVKVGSGGSATPAIVSAPAFQPAVQQVRNVTGASEEERLNRIAGRQRVYILASDLQAERDSSRVQIAETSW